MDEKHGPRFWLGNAILGLGLIAMFYFDQLAEVLGAWAMVVWMGLAALGVYLLTSDKGGPSGLSN